MERVRRETGLWCLVKDGEEDEERGGRGAREMKRGEGDDVCVCKGGK